MYCLNEQEPLLSENKHPSRCSSVRKALLKSQTFLAMFLLFVRILFKVSALNGLLCLKC